MKTAWFIDGAYLFRSAPFDFEFAHLRERVEQRLGYTLSDCYVFRPVDDSGPQVPAEFAESITSAQPHGARARLVPVPAHGHRDAAVAAAITRGLAVTAPRYREVLFTAPHGYYADMLAHLRDDLQVALRLGVYHDASPALHPYADEIIWLDTLWDDLG